MRHMSAAEDTPVQSRTSGVIGNLRKVHKRSLSHGPVVRYWELH
jgi:hypothetical protein